MTHPLRVLAALALFALAGCLDEAPPAVQQLQTADGTPFVLMAMPGAEDVALQAAWATDWFYRPDTNPVAAYVGANLLLAGGAEGWRSDAVVERFADLRAQANLWVTADHVFGQVVMPKPQAQEAVEIVNAHLRAPSLDADWFARLRDQFRDQIAQANAQPTTAVFDALRIAVLRDHPMTEALSLNDSANFTDLALDDIRAWHGETFARARMTLAVAGDLTPAEAQALVEALIRGLPEGETVGQTASALSLATDYTPRQMLLHDPSLTEGILALILPLPPLTEGQELEDIVIATALGQGDQSTLFTTLRTELRASYGVEVGVNGFTRQTRFMVIVARVDPARVQEALEAIVTAYDGFREAATIPGLSAHKESIAANARASAERPGVVVNMAILALLEGQDPAISRDMSGLIAALTPPTVAARLAAQYRPGAELLVVAAAPAADALPDACVITAPREAMGCE